VAQNVGSNAEILNTNIKLVQMEACQHALNKFESKNKKANQKPDSLPETLFCAELAETSSSFCDFKSGTPLFAIEI